MKSPWTFLCVTLLSLWPTLMGAQAFSATEDDFELPELINFKPIETTSTAEPEPAPPKIAKEESPKKDQEIKEKDSSSKVQAESIPENLNRPIRVGLFVGVKELYLKYSGEEIRITPAGNNIKLSSGSHSMEMDSREFSNDDGTCLAVAQDSKSLSQACYPGSIVFRANNGKLDAINIVDVEDYLRGVVPYEIGKLDTSRIEALKAQAVAARTYAYKHFNSRESLGFDVYSDTKDQVYKGLTGATVLTDEAVKSTSGIVMTYQGDFIVAYYHSTCGGTTETLATWNRPDLPYLQSKPDTMSDGTPYCKESSYLKWERKFTDKEMLEMVRQNAVEAKAKFSGFKASDIKKIKSITIKDKLSSGRVLTLVVSTDKGNMEVLTDRTRWLFKKGGSILPASLFTIRHEGGNWIINGAGFGHGVGMCQMGVRARAKAGQSFGEILTHYYPGITLEKFER
ncbi:MAG: SpoIID/LytB domain-containing protein [Fibrobacter sp.]|nr:SpoIID/LytB domain-containing protein [Fibrobacter sp.]